ncbi:MAG: hypothetical protein KC493_06825 [Bacteriovoracaceae bacterium]|nr:hypothetical protein [Bacteriovoracaceae bacterium]
MKNLIIITLLSLISFNAHAEFIGGVVKSKNGRKMAMECTLMSLDRTCEEVAVKVKWSKNYEWETYTTLTLDQMDTTEIRRDAYRNANDDINDSYQTAAMVGFIGGFAVAWTTESGVIGVPAMALGAAIDVVKAPFVGLLYLTHKGSDLLMKRRMMRGLKHMLNPKKQGKNKYLRKRYFENLRSALYNQ